MGVLLQSCFVLLLSVCTVFGTGGGGVIPADPCNGNCVRHSDCVPNSDGVYECACQAPWIGDGYFFCYKPHPCVCWICNDPSTHTINEENIVVPILGSTRVNDFEVARLGPLPDREDRGICKFIQYVWTERVKGKIYIQGTQFTLVQRDANGQRFVFRARITARVNLDTGVYSYVVAFKVGDELTFKYWDTIDTTEPPSQSEVVVEKFGCRIEFKLISACFLRVRIVCCGITLGIRPFNPNNLIKKPGIWIIIQKANKPLFGDWAEGYQPLCLGEGTTVEAITHWTGLADKREAFAYLGTHNGGPLYYPGRPNPQIAGAYRTCIRTPNIDKIRRFYDVAFTIVYESPLVKNCISGDTVGLDNFFEFALSTCKWLVFGDEDACEEAKEAINLNCADLIPRFDYIQRFLNEPCVPGTPAGDVSVVY